MMKVLHLSSARTWRGGEQQIAYLLQGLREFDVRSFVMCPVQAPLASWCSKEGIAHQTYRKANLSPFVIARVIHTVRELRPDIIHVHDAHSHTYAVLAASLTQWHVPLVLHRRVDFPIRPNALSHWKYNHRSIAAILCVSRYIQEIILPDIRRKHLVHTVYSGVDLNRFGSPHPTETGLRHLFEVPAEHAIIASIAMVAPHKDYYTFINTIQQLKAQGLPASYFIIGGDGGEMTHIQRYAQQQGVDKDVTFTGFRKDVAALAQDIDVLLMTSKEEGLCTTILDAFAGRIPVVSTRAGGIPELVKNMVTGLTAPVGDAAQLGTAVLRMLNERQLRDACVEAAYHFVRDFDFHVMAKNVYHYYSKLLESSPSENAQETQSVTTEH